MPLLCVALNRQRSGSGVGSAVSEKQVIKFHVMQFPASGLSLKQHGKTGIFFNINMVNGIHDHAEFYRHNCPVLIASEEMYWVYFIDCYLP
jgi:glycerol-3-phosphate responsive antiterminator